MIAAARYNRRPFRECAAMSAGPDRSAAATDVQFEQLTIVDLIRHGGSRFAQAGLTFGHSFDNASNATRLDGYTLVDLRAEFALSDEVRLFGRVENLFDEDYMTAFRFNSLGRSVYAGIRGRF